MNTKSQALRVRETCAAALFVLLYTWMSPLPAAAQASLFVAITSPTSGSTVSDTIPVNASAAITLVGVQFKLDGADLGAEDTTPPYSVAWNTATASNGPHTLTAIARDLVGFQYTSDPVTVTVANADTTPPSVTITAPANGATVSATVTVTANASDNVGAAGLQFLLDGHVGADDTTAPYAVPVDTHPPRHRTQPPT